MPTNVLGTELKCCCRDPLTGFYRDGFCRTGPEDIGLHTVCVKVTQEFLDYSVLDGNDLVTPHPEFGFPGLKPGDKWCVCVTRWKSALDHNRAAPVDLEATHASALEFVTLEEFRAHALKSLARTFESRRVCRHARSELNLPFSLFLALRYLKPTRTLLSIIAWIAVLGVM